MQPDKLDYEIIALLAQNGRIANNDIAAKLGVSEGTVRNRIKKLTEAKLLHVKGLMDPDLVPGKQILLLGIKVRAIKDLERSAAAVAKLDGVINVSIISGRYDLLAEIFIDPGKIITFISRDLATIDSIASTESFITMKSYNKWV